MKCLSAALIASFCIGFTACSNDDDDDNGGKGGSSAAPTPELTDINGNGVQLTSVGDIWFRYDENGKLSSFGDSDGGYYLDGNSFTLTYKDVESGYLDGYYTSSYTAKVTLNGSGLISKITYTEETKYTDEDFASKTSATVSYQYNSDRQLTGGSMSGSGEWSEDGYHVSYTGTGSLTNTWTNGNLIKSNQESRISGKVSGQSYNQTIAETYTYSYGDMANPIKQMPYLICDNLTGEELGMLGLIGLFGVGPVNLPTVYVVTELEDGEEYSRTSALSYTLNDNGTIATESGGGYKLTYQYGTGTRAIVEQVENQLPAIRKQMKSWAFPHVRQTKKMVE